MTAFSVAASLPPQQIFDGVVVRPLHADRLTLSVVELDSGIVLPEHHHENEQVGMLITGSLRFRIGDEVQDLQAGAMWRIPSDVPHEVHTGPEGAVVIEVFAPPRGDWELVDKQEPRPPRWP